MKYIKAYNFNWSHITKIATTKYAYALLFLNKDNFTFHGLTIMRNPLKMDLANIVVKLKNEIPKNNRSQHYVKTIRLKFSQWTG